MAWIWGILGEDEGDPKGEVDYEGWADRGAPFVEGDRSGE